MELQIAKCCGTCKGSVSPKRKIEDHVAHYSVAKTERWCHKLNIPVSRESFCSDDNYELEVKKGGTPSVKRANSQIKRLEKIIRVKNILKNDTVKDDTSVSGGRTYFVKDDRLCYSYSSMSNYSSIVSCKDSGCDKFIDNFLKNKK